MPLAFPDPIWNPDIISGACFLYFQEPIILTSLPTVSLPILPEAFGLTSLIKKRNPEWTNNFFRLFHQWRKQQESFNKTAELLKPLHGKAYKAIWLSYPRGSSAMKESTALLESTNLRVDEIYQFIDPICAAGELISHILFEMYLEKVYEDKDPEAIFKMGSERARALLTHESIPLEKDRDLEPLFEYCQSLFTRESLPSLLTKSYMFRVPMLKGDVRLLLTNQRLLKFLCTLPVEYTGIGQSSKWIDSDVIAWEIFRQLISPKLDPLDEPRVDLICELRESRKEEIERLRLKCQRLAEHFQQIDTLDQLPEAITTFIKRHVENEIAALLRLNKVALENFFVSLFSDEKTWVAISGLVAGIAGSIEWGTYLTAGSAILALSSIGAKAFKAAAQKGQKLRENDYALIYRISQRT